MGAESEQLWVTRLLDVGRTLMTELDEEVVLGRVLEIAREATGARYAAIGVLDAARIGLDRFITVGIDAETRAAIGDNPLGRGVLGQLIEDPQPLRLAEVGRHPKSFGFPAGHPVMRTFLGVPIVIRGQAWGNLYLTEKQDGGEFTEEDQRAAIVLAEWAAVAIVNARLYETSERRRRELEKAVLELQAERLRSTLAAADAERRRWSRELHDETLQGLGGMRLLLTAALRTGEGERITAAAQEAVGHVEREIRNLRSIISELRPAALDELGLRDAVEALVEQHADANGLRIEADLGLRKQTGEQRLHPELEVGVYRLIQEALTNVVKHAQASRVELSVQEHDEEISVEVRDDGIGFDAETVEGFGLTGMRERVRLVGGMLEISSGDTGTSVRARMSCKRVVAAPGQARTHPERAA